MLQPDLVERVLARLGLADRPGTDLDGLNSVYAAISRNLSNDNIQKRIWFGGGRTTPVAGGEPTEFFENWLAHGTGGTCFPINGAMFALLEALEFPARRIAGTMMEPGAVRGISNHGSVIVAFDGVDYVVDAQISGFEALPLDPARETRTTRGIHTIRAFPIEDGFEIRFFTGHARDKEYRFQTEPESDPVDHARFLSLYDRSAKQDGYSPFNAAMYICRHFDDSILTLHRGFKYAVAQDGSVTTSEVDDVQTRDALITEFGISEEAVVALPEDEPGPDMS